MNNHTDGQAPLTRRQVVAGGAAGVAALSGGCLGSVRNLLGLASASQVSLRVVAPPVDWDRRANEIAGQLVNRLEKVGVDTRFPLLPPEQFREQILYRRDFDVYVGTMPVRSDPDFLRPLLTSTRTNELGWQNPFGFTDKALDERLDAQRRQAGADRADVVRDMLQTIAGEQPFVPIATDRAIAAVRTDAFAGWERTRLRDPTWLFEIEPVEESVDGQTLRVTAKDKRITERLNPLVPWINEFDLVRSLLYDPLARYYDGAVRPWLAREWSIDGDELTVTLRPGLRWHDGEPLTAEDVRFTYQFVSDTSLDSTEAVYPAPTFQRQASLVDEVTVLGERQVRMRMDASGAVAPDALTVALLPKHIWESRTNVVDAQTGLTRAITHGNTDAIGSGPMALKSRRRERSLRLSRVGNHPVNRDDDSELARRFGPLAFTELVVRVTPSDLTMVSFLEEGKADVTVPHLDNEVVSRIVTNDELSVATSPSRTLYHVGFNARRRPLRTPGFRRAVAHLINKASVVDSVFGGYADPHTSPVLDESWIPGNIRWNGGDPEVPFAGVEDELDADRAREHFRAAGFHYGEDGRLVY
ncbi:ABC transporter substrate-binding protein [Halapricum hydrolyticum]|uniref:ABC transporter substrate-binding protein n=1 Tax=Halapricum hydrolyticum TaxID=2979991 RepID=A0AAE3LGN6_9EURY|nr:ABC transporter substrate-binding protein [Halapricum hydrolyticum]MCU4716561.1 ABC transporter substrate-binding protein [Halapricum hydrolyticum]MCU4725834.1 ABC transporter substrate-binding protein [Halapricum hydrolyticum]